MDDFERDFYEVEDLLRALEKLYDKDVVDLKTYFQIKSNIISKLITASRQENEALADKMNFN